MGYFVVLFPRVGIRTGVPGVPTLPFSRGVRTMLGVETVAVGVAVGVIGVELVVVPSSALGSHSTPSFAA